MCAGSPILWSAILWYLHGVKAQKAAEEGLICAEPSQAEISWPPH